MKKNYESKLLHFFIKNILIRILIVSIILVPSIVIERKTGKNRTAQISLKKY